MLYCFTMGSEILNFIFCILNLSFDICYEKAVRVLLSNYESSRFSQRYMLEIEFDSKFDCLRMSNNFSK